MTRQFINSCIAACLLALLPAASAGADELPVRKAGLWELKLLRPGTAMPETTMQHCTDESIDKVMNSPAAIKQTCSKNDIRKTATGYVTDSVCKSGATTVTTHSETTGDFNSAYTVKATAHSDGGPTGATHDTTTTIEAKWLGACKGDQKPGDIVMPGGMKMNILELDKLKAMMPKQLPK
jgi:hypothetical protein